MNDVDVLVPTPSARAAIDVLAGAGLMPVNGVPPWYVAEYAPRFSPNYGFADEADRQLHLHRVAFGRGPMMGACWPADGATPSGRGAGTLGAVARLLLRVEDPAAALEFEAIPFLGRPGRRLTVEVTANGCYLTSVGYYETRPHTTRMALPAAAVGPAGELALCWRIRDPASPLALGVSRDVRTLGQFLRRLAVMPRDREGADGLRPARWRAA